MVETEEMSRNDLILENTKLRVENNRLQERDRLLDALEAAGVDNWEGYDVAMDILQDEN